MNQCHRCKETGVKIYPIEPPAVGGPSEVRPDCLKNTDEVIDV